MDNQVEQMRRKKSESRKTQKQLKTKPLKNKEADELRKSEEKYRMLVENSLQGLAIIHEGRILFCNNAFAAISGYSIDELLAFPDARLLLHPDDQELVVKRHNERLNGKAVTPHYEYRIIRKDGMERWLEVYASLIDFNGKPAIQIVHLDITERRQAENALKESEERFRLIAETIDEIFWVFDVEKQDAIYLSPAHERIWGYSKDKFFHTQAPFFDPIHPDDRERVAATTALMKTGQVLDFEHRIVRPDGSIRHLWNRGYPVPDETGYVKRYVGVAQDVTEWRRAETALKESTEYLNQIINHIGDPVFVKDRFHRFILVNDALCEFTGASREDLLEKTGFDSIPKEEADSILEQEKKVLESGRESVTEDSFTDRNGFTHTMMAKKTLLTDKGGNKQIIGVLRDITELKRLEAQFYQAQKMEAVGVLAGGVAHDFNNLLTVIQGYAELAKKGLAQNDFRRKDIEQIEKAANGATSLTSQLLAFSRKQILQPKIIGLNDVITDMSSMLRRLIGEDIELRIVNEPVLGLINADPGQIQQIVMNLAVNARDAMPNGGKLTIETTNADFDENYVQTHSLAKIGSYVMLAISDSGKGMDSETKEHLFEPFFTTKAKGKGTGLGLSTVYGIVKQSGGFIWAYSELDKGTTFKIYLPRTEGEADRFESKLRPVSEFLGYETVIVVEDDVAVRELAVRILRGQGYNVIEASGGHEALRISQEFKGDIHLILTDVVMPGMSGKELVQRITAERPGIKALFVSGYADNAIIHHGILDSNVVFLQKPFTDESLARKVLETIHA